MLFKSYLKSILCKKLYLYSNADADTYADAEIFKWPNINCQKVSVSELIITKVTMRKEDEGEVNYSSLHTSKHVIKSFPQLLIVHGFAQNVHIFILQKVP